MNVVTEVLSSSVGQTVVSGLVSVATGWVIAWMFYRKATRDLVEENRKLIYRINLVLWGLESAGHFKLERDEKGDVVSVAVELKADLVSTSSMTGTLHGGELLPAHPVARPWWKFWERWP